MQIIFKQPSQRKDIIKLDINTAINIHPQLEVLRKVNFEGWFDFQYKSFYIEFGDRLEKSILTKSVLNIKEDIEKYLQGVI